MSPKQDAISNSKRHNPMTTSKARTRSYTISIRALTPNNPDFSSANPKRPCHKPTKSTPYAMSLAAEHFPSLTPSSEGSHALPRHNRELTLRRYLFLQDEHESIRRHLDALSSDKSFASTSTSSTTTTSPGSPALSPTRASAFGHRRTDSALRRASTDAPRPRCHGRRSRVPDMTVVDPVTLAEMLSEEARLFTINEGIKRSLTELLNCETVRGDQALRQWIMTRLLEVEKELRSGRRRRSCPSE